MKLRKLYSLLLGFIFLILSCSFVTIDRIDSNKSGCLNLESFMDSIITNFKRKYDSKTGLEIYDFETAEKLKMPSSTVVKTSDGWTILIHPMVISGGTYDEYSPANEFQMVQKQFYPTGTLKQKSHFFQSNLKIGIWEYYDENGNLIKTVDEDEKFKKSNVQLKDVLDLLEKEGWIDQKTGKGGTEIIVKGDVVIINPGFNVMFTTDDNGRNVWYGSVLATEILGISYKIDCETGEVTKEEVPIITYE